MIFYYWLLWILPLQQHPIWGQKIGPLTVFEYLGIACFIYAFVHVLSRRIVPSLLGTWEVRLVLFLYLIEFFSVLTKGHGIGLSESGLIVYTS
jgi:hypothetical protein